MHVKKSIAERSAVDQTFARGMYSRLWQLANPEKLRAYCNSERGRSIRRAATARYNKSDKGRDCDKRHRNGPFKPAINMRARIRQALKGLAKSARTQKLLGCTISEFRTWLQCKFVPGMTWANYGPVWHVDHVRPCASFDLSDPAQQRACFHFTNTQPMFAIPNIVKGARWP